MLAYESLFQKGKNPMNAKSEPVSDVLAVSGLYQVKVEELYDHIGLKIMKENIHSRNVFRSPKLLNEVSRPASIKF